MKKFINYFIVLFLCIFCFISGVNAADVVCSDKFRATHEYPGDDKKVVCCPESGAKVSATGNGAICSYLNYPWTGPYWFAGLTNQVAGCTEQSDIPYADGYSFKFEARTDGCYKYISGMVRTRNIVEAENFNKTACTRMANVTERVINPAENTEYYCCSNDDYEYWYYYPQGNVCKLGKTQGEANNQSDKSLIMPPIEVPVEPEGTTEELDKAEQEAATEYNRQHMDEITESVDEEITSNIAESRNLKQVKRLSPKEKEKLSYKQIDACKNKNVIAALKIVGNTIALIKIIIPAILVIVSCKSLALAVINENDEIKTKTRVIIIRVVLAIVIFLLPSIMRIIYDSAISDSKTSTYQACVDCVLDTDACPTEGLYCLADIDKKSGEPSYVDCDALGDNKNGECDSAFGDPTNPNDLAYYLQMALDIMKWSGLILCILLSIVDVLKAIFGEDKEMQKTIAGNIIKRISYCVILIFLPTLINTIFKLFGLYGTCGIK